VAIRPPKYNSQGFTLIEMVVTLMVAGIIFGFAVPSFLSWNKPLRDGSLQFKSHLSLIRSKAISSSKSYRIRPKFTVLNDYTDKTARNFVVEYADNCKMPENSATPVAARWQMASQFDLNLPPNIGIPTTATTLPTIGTVTNSLDWTPNGSRVCFDSRGILEDTNTRIVLRDFQGFNRAKLAALELTKVGGVDVNTYTENTPATFTAIDPSSQGNPEF
jgi:prepilin-type N-terminal cleavage/methylation domain-containing protein